MSLKDDLRPTGKNRVIDLVQAAGLDVSDWGKFGRGPKWAAANPKYCYEWSFVQPGRAVVLNLWYANLRERAGLVSISTNMRQEAQRLERMRAKSVWVKRAFKMDEAIAFAFSEHLRIRAIINDGEMRDIFNPRAKASEVKSRSLDPVAWTVASYQPSSGQATLVRGGAPILPVDQFDLNSPETPAPNQVIVSGKVFVRDPAVRAAALARARGRCGFCGQPGFMMPSGQVFLETHHIIALSEGGSDVIANVAAVCPNHHREAHHGDQANLIRAHLLQVVASHRRTAV